MSLIEQLGGYEKAKEWYAKETKRLGAKGLWSWKFSELQNEMLEYRRENNIFENGDKVVHIYDCENSMIFTVKDISNNGYSFGNDWGWFVVLSNMGVGYTFKHATPQEIEAGRRLD